MSTQAAPAPLARVALARGPLRLLAAPTVVLLSGLLVWVAAALVGPGAPAIALAVVGAVAVVVGLWLAVRLVSLRLVVEVDYLHLRGVGTDRRYHLVPGSLSRLATRGPRRASLRTRLGSLGWAVGPSVLPSGERIEVIRLGTTPSVILVPTERGRVALAVQSEAALLESLTAAARTRDLRSARPWPAFAATPMAPVAEAAVPITPARPLTGIERMLLEERLTTERQAALVGARGERAAASFTASVAALTPAGTTVTLTPSVATAPTAPAPAVSPPRLIPRRRPLQPMARRVGRVRPVALPPLSPALVLLAAPLLAAIVVWGVAAGLGVMPAAAGMDPLAAVLLLCGPVAVVAIWLAQSRWPRLAGLTSVSALIALLLVTRAVVG